MSTLHPLGNTGWQVVNFAIVSEAGLVHSGIVSVSGPNGQAERYDWKATYRGENRWEITGPGAMAGGKRVPVPAQAPFRLDPAFNMALSAYIKEQCNDYLERKGIIKTVADITVSPRPSPAPPEPVNSIRGVTTKSAPGEFSTTAEAPTSDSSGANQLVLPQVQEPLPANSGNPSTDPSREGDEMNTSPKTASLADRVAAKVCATYDDMTVEEMRNSEKRGLFAQARQIIAYLLRELEEKAPIALEAIGASKTANSVFYVHHHRVVELMKEDDAFREKVNKLRVEFNLDPVVETGREGSEPEPGAERVVITPVHSAPPRLADGSERGNALVERIAKIVSEIVCTPVLLGNLTDKLDLGPARLATTLVLFDHEGMTAEQITAVSVSGRDVNEVNRDIVSALTHMRSSDSEVSRIVNLTKQRLRFREKVEPLPSKD